MPGVPPALTKFSDHERRSMRAERGSDEEHLVERGVYTQERGV